MVNVVVNEWCLDYAPLGTIRVANGLILSLASYRQLEHTTPESGGVLMGSFLNSNGALLLDQFTPPQITDSQGRCNFYRSEEHNRLVNKIWQQSDYKTTYLGLWHTHPEAIPNYSYIDTKDWRCALNQSKFEGNCLFFFIVGTTHVRCWVGEKKRFGNPITLISEFEIEKD